MKTILVVEDDISLQNAIVEKLTSEKYEVLTAKDSATAKDLLSKGGIDLVWLDHYLLGDETGLDLLGYMKKDEKLKNIPVFLISNTAGADKVTSYMHLGVEKYYVKADVSLKDIITQIDEFVKETD